MNRFVAKKKIIYTEFLFLKLCLCFGLKNEWTLKIVFGSSLEIYYGYVNNNHVRKGINTYKS